MRVLNAHKEGKDAPNSVYIGRPSRFGNHFRIGAEGGRDKVLIDYRRWLNKNTDLILEMRESLAGKDLMCWCAPKMCHGHIIRDVVMAPSLVAQGFAKTEHDIRVYDEIHSASFSRAREAHGIFGNMSGGCPLFIKGIKVATTENLYQALRFPDHPHLQAEILAEKNGYSAKKLAYEHLEKTRPDWHKVNVPLMRFVLHIKLCEHHDRISDALAETKSLPIVEKSHKDSFWGAKPYINPRLNDPHSAGLLVGQNVLGRLFMDMRSNLGLDPTYGRSPVAPPDLPDVRLMGEEILPYEPCGGDRPSQGTFDL